MKIVMSLNAEGRLIEVQIGEKETSYAIARMLSYVSPEAGLHQMVIDLHDRDNV